MSALPPLDQLVVLLNDDGFYRLSFQLSPLGPAEQALSALAGRIPIRVNSFAKVNSLTMHMLCGAQIVVWARLPYIELNMFWRKQDHVLTPRCDGSGNNALRRWTPPDDMALHYFMAVTPNQQRTTYRWNTALFAASSPNQAGWFLPPLPNLFPDGRVCMGSSFIPLVGSLTDMYINALNYFMASPYNADLLAQKATPMQRMFRYDEEGKQLPMELGDGTWENLCEKSNHQLIAEI